MWLSIGDNSARIENLKWTFDSLVGVIGNKIGGGYLVIGTLPHRPGGRHDISLLNVLSVW